MLLYIQLIIDVSNGCLFVCMYVCVRVFILYYININIIYRTDQQHQPKIKVEVEGMTHSLRLLYC
jgi:hypothetical protein